MEFNSIILTKIVGGDGQTSLKSAHVAGGREARLLGLNFVPGDGGRGAWFGA